MPDGLSVSRLIDVRVNLTPLPSQFPNFNTALVLGTSDVIDVSQRIRQYDNLDEVATDFGTSAEEYLAAQAWFGQSPQPSNLLIGRWADEATNGLLVGGPVAAANRLIAPWAAIDDGAFRITIDDVGPTEVGNLDFTACENLNAVAAVITSGFPGGTAICTWDADRGVFVITSQSTGVDSTVSFLTAPNAGTDISGMLVMTQTSGNGAYVADGVAAQTAAETVALFQLRFGSQWYGLCIPSAEDADHLAVAALVEAADPPHYYGLTSSAGGIITPDDTGNIAYLLKAQGYNKTYTQYSSTDPYAVMSALARILTTNWAGNNTTITLMYKQEPGVTAEQLTATQMDALLANNANVFVGYNNGTAIIQPGQSASGQFTDSVIGCDWLRAQIQNNLFNLLYGSATKIPQTDQGMQTLSTGIEAACVQGVNNGLIAPGQWNAGGVGQVAQGDYLPTGYYVYTPPISSQSEAARAARRSVAFQVLVKLGGAVHTAEVSVNVNP